MNPEAAKKLEVIKRVLKSASEDVRPPAPMWHNDFLEVAVKRIEEVQALAALPEKPRTEEEIATIIDNAMLESAHYGASISAHGVVRALKAANVLFVKED